MLTLLCSGALMLIGAWLMFKVAAFLIAAGFTLAALMILGHVIFK